MRNLPLNQFRVDRLKPRNSTYDIRDTDLNSPLTKSALDASGLV